MISQSLALEISVVVLLTSLLCNAAHASKYEACNAFEVGEVRSNVYSLENCSLDELTLILASRFLESDPDDMEFEILGGGESSLNATAARLENIVLTPDQQLIRVDWESSGANTQGDREVKWASIRRSGWFWATRRAIAPGERVAEDDVQRLHGPVSTPNRLRSETWPDDVIANAAMSEGDVVSPNEISLSPDLLAGDTVFLKIQRGPISMQLAGVLQEAAFQEKAARLKLNHSGATVYGRLEKDNIILPCDSELLFDRNSCVD